ncbi:hypothetical protein BDZ89DRAFT_1138890 [Hymenopellis radicata]|nr:hypothetical protein BDZ89DRAFT_1138890 [Hymenopellis radicata]
MTRSRTCTWALRTHARTTCVWTVGRFGLQQFLVKNINLHQPNINGFNGVRIPSPFLRDTGTLNGNHFLSWRTCPTGQSSSQLTPAAMILDWKTNTETCIPGIPNGVRITSPFSAGASLLPLTPENGYTPEIMTCDGSTVSDSVNPSTLSSQ